MSWLHYPAQGVVIALLIAANAFFVATEFAFVKIRESQLKSMRVKGKKDWRLGLALRVTKHLDRYLSATQLGITLTSLGLGWVGEPVVARWIEGPLADLGIVSQRARSFPSPTDWPLRGSRSSTSSSANWCRNISPSGARARW